MSLVSWSVGSVDVDRSIQQSGTQNDNANTAFDVSVLMVTEFLMEGRLPSGEVS